MLGEMTKLILQERLEEARRTVTNTQDFIDRTRREIEAEEARRDKAKDLVNEIEALFNFGKLNAGGEEVPAPGSILLEVPAAEVGMWKSTGNMRWNVKHGIGGYIDKELEYETVDTVTGKTMWHPVPTVREG